MLNGAELDDEAAEKLCSHVSVYTVLETTKFIETIDNLETNVIGNAYTMVRACVACDSGLHLILGHCRQHRRSSSLFVQQ